MKRPLVELAVGLLLAWMVYLMLSPYLDVLIYSVFLYYVSRPVYTFFKKLKASPVISSAATLFLVVIPVTVLILYTIAVASVDIISFISESDLAQLEDLRQLASQYASVARELEPGEIYNALIRDETFSGLYKSLSNLFLDLLDLAFRMFLAFTITFYLLLDGKKLREAVEGLLSRRHKMVFKNFFDKLDYDLSHVYVGNIATAILTGFIGTILFHILNYFMASNGLEIPYATALGLMCGLTSVVPVVGVALVWLPVGGYLFTQAYFQGVLGHYWWYPLVYMALTFVAADWLPNVLIRPRLSGGRIHQGAMLMAYIFGTSVFGFVGLFLGPLILVAVIDYLEVIHPHLRKRLHQVV